LGRSDTRAGNRQQSASPSSGAKLREHPSSRKDDALQQTGNNSPSAGPPRARAEMRERHVGDIDEIEWFSAADHQNPS
jgi:hypothetical protein